MWAYTSTKSAANCAFYLNVEMQNTKRCIASATYILCKSNITRGSTRYVEPINRFENPIKEGGATRSDPYRFCIVGLDQDREQCLGQSAQPLIGGTYLFLNVLCSWGLGETNCICHQTGDTTGSSRETHYLRLGAWISLSSRAILGPFLSGAVMHHVSPQDCSIQCMVLPRPDPKFVWWIPFFPCWIHILSRFLLVKPRWNPHFVDERDHFCCWFREIGHIQTSKSTTSQRRSNSTTPEGYGRLRISSEHEQQ